MGWGNGDLFYQILETYDKYIGNKMSRHSDRHLEQHNNSDRHRHAQVEIWLRIAYKWEKIGSLKTVLWQLVINSEKKQNKTFYSSLHRQKPVPK